MITRLRSLLSHGFLALALSVSVAEPVLPSARAADDASVPAAATTAMQTWLKDIDAGHYAPSWQNAGALFQKAITSEGWVNALNQVRKPLGACQERTLVRAQYLTKLPGTATPEGHFVVAQFETGFAQMPKALETVTFAKEPDGVWKSIGYFIKPR